MTSTAPTEAVPPPPRAPLSAAGRAARWGDAWELTRALTRREIRSQYKGSALGWLWSLVNPLAMVGTYSLVFKIIFRAPTPEGDPSGLEIYSLFLVTGLIPWNLFSAGVTGCAGALVGQAALLSKVYFPRSTVVVAKVLAVAFTSLIEFAVVLVILLIAGNMVLPWLPVAAMLFGLELAMVLGIGLGLSVCNVYFRDVQYLLTIGLQLLFYATPVIYPMTLLVEGGVSQRVLDLFNLNPLTRLMDCWRAVLYDLRFPAWGDVAYVAGFAAVCLVVGAFVFSRLQGRLVEEL
ncbi:MAG: ABC transporter permease [Acidimicrobiia bacterium]|nr:ABC transporter permease [Acidimicrobiia bacterium]